MSRRRALPAPGGSASTQRDYVAPQGPLETALAGIWSEILQVERVGRYASFFELGGQSLLVVRMISRVRQTLGLNLALSSVFAHPVLHDFASVASQTQTAALPALAPVARRPTCPCRSRSSDCAGRAIRRGRERRLSLPIGLRLRGRLPVGVAGGAGSHRAASRGAAYPLRLVDDQPVQRISAAAPSNDVPDLHSTPTTVTPRGTLSGWRRASPSISTAGPLFRGRLLRLEEQDHVLL